MDPKQPTKREAHAFWPLIAGTRASAASQHGKVRGDCSGIDQAGQSFTAILSAGLSASPTPEAAGSASGSTPTPQASEDDPRTSPYPIWDPAVEYHGGTKVVWHHVVYESKWTSRGFPPDTQVTQQYETPWRLIGPVLAQDTPAPLPSVAPGTYPTWRPDKAYVAGSRVQVGSVPYQARWWTKGQAPSPTPAGDSAWELVPQSR